LKREPLSVRHFVGAGYAIILGALAALLWLLAYKLAELWLAFRDVEWPLDGDLLLILAVTLFAAGCLLLYRSVKILERIEEDVKRGLD